MESRFGHEFSQVRVHSDVTRTIQPRLAIGKRDDEHERAADLTANQVLGRPKIPSVPGESDQGNDFSGVIIHTGARAAESARSVNALSYTVGNHIVFGEGQYAPQFTSGRRLLAHELTHVLQQSQGGAANGMVMGTWDDAPGECSDIGNKTIDRVVVEQEIPQSVTLHWNDGSIESASCSTGKGHCCVDPANPDGVACTVTGSRVNGSNCTPITERQGYAIRNRYRTYNGWEFWNDFVTSRGIGLHQYPRLDGTPLSHGCVRLERDTARKIFCGARQNDTKVQVQGFARPMCNHANLLKEWYDDFNYARTPTDGENVSASVRRGIRSTRQTLRTALGLSSDRQLTETISGLQEQTQGATTGPAPLSRQRVASIIPRCGETGALPTSEEARLTGPVSAQGTVPARILAESNFDRFLTPFTSALSGTRSLRSARRAVREHARALWDAAAARAQGSSSSAADTDDRPLYWARLQLARTLRQWSPRFRLGDAQRQTLLDLFEQASRGMDTTTFSGAEGVKKILISGFDPFGLGSNIRTGNPSGAAAMAMETSRRKSRVWCSPCALPISMRGWSRASSAHISLGIRLWT